MKIAFITTVNHNIGDDMVRYGIIYLLKKRLGPFDSLLIHKHIPLTVRPELEWLYYCGLTKVLDKLPRARGAFWSRVIDKLPLNKNTDKILNCDLLVQSGAPFYYCFPDGSGIHNNEWDKPLIRNRYLKIRENVNLINIGVGSCQPYNSDGSEFLTNAPCADYIKEFHSLCKLTVIRDRLSKKILNSLGLDAPLLPCPSIFAMDHFGISPAEPGYIALNYMALGGHYEFGQNINRKKWRDTFIAFYNMLQKEHSIVIVCHDENELRIIKKMLPEAKTFFSGSLRNYMDFYSKSKAFIGCRVHGAFAAASFGKPAMVIGSDTRAHMINEIGLKSIFVKDVMPDLLMDNYRALMSEKVDYSEIFNKIKEEAVNNYISIFSSICHAS